MKQITEEQVLKLLERAVAQRKDGQPTADAKRAIARFEDPEVKAKFRAMYNKMSSTQEQRYSFLF